MKKVIITLLVAVFLFGCASPDNPGGKGTGKLPGKFSVTVLSDAMGSNARGVSLGTYTVANSKNIYFILRNVGDFPITDITLTPGKLNKNGGAFVPITDNGVTASPGAITVLETSGKTSVETVIEVDINHGNVIGLISQQYVQKADFKGTTVRIAGNTKDEEGNDITISLDLDIETFIKVASFEVVYSDDNGATYKKAEVDDTMWYNVPTAGKNYIKIYNTGNMPLRYKAWDSNVGSNENSVEWITIAAGNYSDSITFNFQHRLSFVIDTIGVAFDNGEFEYLVFRAGTSIVINNYQQSDNRITLYVD